MISKLLSQSQCIALGVVLDNDDGEYMSKAARHGGRLNLLESLTAVLVLIQETQGTTGAFKSAVYDAIYRTKLFVRH